MMTDSPTIPISSTVTNINNPCGEMCESTSPQHL
jgi:hypothetical protein